MAEFWTQERLDVASLLLNFPLVIRCDAIAGGGRCRDEARCSMRCRECNEMTVFCGIHTQFVLSVSVVRCGKCKRTSGRAQVLFEVEALR